jgi:hypothetical protein
MFLLHAVGLSHTDRIVDSLPEWSVGGEGLINSGEVDSRGSLVVGSRIDCSKRHLIGIENAYAQIKREFVVVAIAC